MCFLWHYKKKFNTWIKPVSKKTCNLVPSWALRISFTVTYEGDSFTWLWAGHWASGVWGRRGGWAESTAPHIHSVKSHPRHWVDSRHMERLADSYAPCQLVFISTEKRTLDNGGLAKVVLSGGQRCSYRSLCLVLSCQPQREGRVSTWLPSAWTHLWRSPSKLRHREELEKGSK